MAIKNTGEKTLLQKAKEIEIKNKKAPTLNATPELIELVLAYLDGEVTEGQLKKVLGTSSPSTPVIRVLKHLYFAGKLGKK